jgi:NitT/TauT family transport system substrate-binding protein
MGALAILALAALLAPAQSAEPDKVKLRLGWSYIGMFAPIYLGMDKGYFKGQGIDLEVLEGKGTVPSATSVANGTEDFGFFDMSAAARLIDKGLPLKGIAQIRQRSSMGIVSLKKTGITKPKDLEGHSLSHTPGDSTSQIFPAFVKTTGIDVSKIKEEGLDYSIYLKSLVGGQVDATMGYMDDEGMILENQGEQINFMMFADYGVTIVDYGFATNLNMIKDKPDLVKRFVAAVVESFTYANAHVDEAVAAGQKRFPEFSVTLAKKQMEFQPVLNGDSVKQGKPIGWIETAVWQKALDTLHDYMGLKDTNAQRYFTNEFISASK